MKSGVVIGVGSLFLVGVLGVVLAVVPEEPVGGRAQGDVRSIDTQSDVSGDADIDLEQERSPRHTEATTADAVPESTGARFQPLSRRDDSARPRADTGGWTPDPELLERAVQLALETDPNAEAPSWRPPWDADDIAALRAGLRLNDDDLARQIARQFPVRVMDVWEMDRAAELLIPLALIPVEEGGVSFETFELIASRDQAGRAVAALPDIPDLDHVEFVVQRIGSRATTPEDLGEQADALVEAGGPNPIANHLVLHLGAVRSGRRRIARGLLSLMRQDALSGGERAGLPAELRRLLEVVDAGDGDWELHTVEAFALRWLLDETPGIHDLDLLTSVAASYDDEVSGAVWIAVGRIDEERAAEALRKLVAQGSGEVQDAAALSALARRGDDAALKRLRERAESEAFALMLLLAEHPTAGRDLLSRTLFRRRADAHDGARHLDEALEARFYWGYDWPAASFRGLEREALQSGIDGGALLRLALLHPTWHTEAVARKVVRRLSPDAFNEFMHGGDPESALSARAFLELGARQELMDRLWGLGWGQSPGSETSWDAGDLTRWTAQLGDPRAITRIGEWGRRQHESGDDPEVPGHPESYYLSDLARSRTPEVRLLVRRLATEAHASDDPEEFERRWDAADALCIAEGVHEDATRWIDPFHHPELWEEYRSSVLGGDVDSAVARLLEWYVEHEEGETLPPFGTGAGPRTRAALRRLADRPELGLRAEALFELAVAGDPSARAEIRRAWDDGRAFWLQASTSVWMGDRTPRQLTFGFEPETLDEWIARTDDEAVIDSLRHAADEAFLAPFIHQVELGSSPGFTAHEALLSWRRDWSMPFTRVRDIECFVPVPR